MNYADVSRAIRLPSESMMTAGKSCSQNFSAVCTRRFNGLIKPAFSKKINQRTVSRRAIINAAAVAPNAKTTGRILFFVRQKSVFCSAVRYLLHLFAENSGIKFNRAIEVSDRNVGPTKCVGVHPARPPLP